MTKEEFAANIRRERNGQDVGGDPLENAQICT